MAAVLSAALILPGCIAEDAVRLPSWASWPAAYLWEEPFPQLVVEIDHTSDFRPENTTVTALSETLRAVTGKREIRFVLETNDFGPVDHTTRWGEDEVWAVAQSSNGGFQSRTGPEARMHFVYVHGRYQDRPPVLAEARGTEVVRFDTRHAINVSEWPGGWPGGEDDVARQLDRHVTIHELGHLLGLVDRIPMTRDRYDANSTHSGHSTNPLSAMHVVNPQNDSDGRPYIPFTFDADDLADLENYKEIGRRWWAAYQRGEEYHPADDPGIVWR